jgi:hypothetical protein
MADSDYNFIPPVEHLQNVPGLTPAKEREERKRRPRTPAGKSEPAKQDEQKENDPKPDDDGSHAIDYCA